MLRFVILSLLLCTTTPIVLAQHEHTSSTQSNLVDGSVHPELIPDSSAYRLYFVAVSEMPNATGTAQQRELAYLRKIGLHSSDLETLITILNNFKAQYSEMITVYNQSATVANAAGAQADVAGFMSQRDALVQSVRDEIKAKLSPTGLARLDAHVQSEKKRMKVAVKGGTQ